MDGAGEAVEQELPIRSHTSVLGPVSAEEQIVSWAALPVANPVLNPDFSQGLTYWSFETNYQAPFFNAFVVSDTFDAGGYALRLGIDLNPEAPEMVGTRGYYYEFYQDLDLTGVPALYFDLKIESSLPPEYAGGYFRVAVYLGEVLVYTFDEQDGPVTYRNLFLDCATLTGVQQLKFRLVSYGGNIETTESRAFYFGNIKTYRVTPAFSTLPTGSLAVLGLSAIFNPVTKVVYFLRKDGTGSFNIDPLAIDFGRLLGFLPTPTPETLQGEVSHRGS